MTVTKVQLKEIYDLIKLSEERLATLSSALAALSNYDFTCGVYDYASTMATSKAVKLLLGEGSFDEWEYLLYEAPGSFTTASGKTYPIRNFDDLWDYWEKEELT